MVKHTRGVDKVVADALSCMFHDSSNEDVDVASGAWLESLPFVYSFLKECQENEELCVEVLRKIQDMQTGRELLSA